MNKLFTVIDGKFKFSAQESHFAPFVGNETKVKIPSETKPPLEGKMYLIKIYGLNLIITTIVKRPKESERW